MHYFLLIKKSQNFPVDIRLNYVNESYLKCGQKNIVSNQHTGMHGKLILLFLDDISYLESICNFLDMPLDLVALSTFIV